MRHNNLCGIHILLPLIFMILSCNSEKTEEKSDQEDMVTEFPMELDHRYSNVDNIISIARCSSFLGTYTTEIHSNKNNYTYFNQDAGGGRKMEIILQEDNVGFLLDSLGSPVDTLNEFVYEMIKGHELHKLHIMPEKYFSGVKFLKDSFYLNQPYQVYRGKDVLNNPVDFLYNQRKKIISGINLTNSMDTTQIIEIKYNNWNETEYGPMVSDALIIQAGNQNFSFEFDTVIINSENFTQLTFD